VIGIVFSFSKEKAMRNNNEDPYNQNRSAGDRSSNEPARDRADITDPARDRDRLKPDEANFELPDVKDIPGQEFVHAPPMGAFADTTISSADEEGEGVFEDDEEDETSIIQGTTADLSKEDKRVLETAEYYMPTRDEESLHQAELDDTDSEGDSLNERSVDLSGSDLDIPVDESDARNENSGQGDEENKFFSGGSEENDANETRS
jgi:hypothetical protein